MHVTGDKGTRLFTKEGHLAIQLPPANKIEAQMMGGMAINKQKHDLMKVALVMAYPKFAINAGDSIIIRADSGFKSWAREVYVIEGSEFVLCPESDVIGCEQTW